MFWKKWHRKGRNSRFGYAALWAAAGAWVLLACGLAMAADKVKDLQDHFDKDPRASSKIKELDKLGDAQFESAGKAILANDYVTAGFTFEKYRDNVRAALELLRKQEPDADRHPGAYRLLELQVRKGIRQVEEAQMVAPQELRPPLALVHGDLITIDDQLIHLLFPRRSKDPEKPSSVPEVKP